MAVRFAMQNNNAPADVEFAVESHRQVLTFALGAETYGVDILRLKEIRGWSSVTRLPHSPPAVLGVLNLRGVVVPIIDLRLRFGMPAAEFTKVTVIIVLSLRRATGDQEFGIVVDRVMDVVDVTAEQIKPAPATGCAVTADVIEGIVTVDEQMLILLEAERLIFTEPAAAALPQVAA